MQRLYRGPETPGERLQQKEAAAKIGVSQPFISNELKRGRLKSLSPDDVKEYKQNRNYREQYYKKREERENRMHEEHMSLMRSQNDSLRLIAVAIAALTVKDVVK